MEPANLEALFEKVATIAAGPHADLLEKLIDPLFKGAHPLPGNPEDVEKRVPKRFCFGLFRGRLGPFLGKS